MPSPDVSPNQFEVRSYVVRFTKCLADCSVKGKWMVKMLCEAPNYVKWSRFLGG